MHSAVFSFLFEGSVITSFFNLDWLRAISMLYLFFLNNTVKQQELQKRVIAWLDHCQWLLMGWISVAGGTSKQKGKKKSCYLGIFVSATPVNLSSISLSNFSPFRYFSSSSSSSNHCWSKSVDRNVGHGDRRLGVLISLSSSNYHGRHVHSQSSTM